MKYQAICPKNPPDDVDANDYRNLIEHNPQCINFAEGRCGSVPCAPADDDGFYKVEVDHCQSRKNGGDSSSANIQLMCGCANRSKYIGPDPNYLQTNFFDQPIDIENLRIHQRLKAYNLVRFDYKHLFENPQQLMRTVMLLGWMVGAGKTIGMMSILFAYNQVRLMKYSASKRAKRVLWLVHQTTLVKSLKHELVDDLIKNNIIKSPPRIEVVEEACHWGFEADIVVACPQALWPNKGRALDDRAISEILDRFEVIVIDEGHYAIDKYLQIMKLAPHALKFAITATPMDADGNLLCEMDDGRYKDRFTLLSSFSYDEGRTQGIFKLLTPFKDGLHNQYHPVNGGESEIRKGIDIDSGNDTSIIHNITRANGVIGRAIQEAKIEDRLVETYDNHIMIRVGSIAHAKSWLDTLSKSNHDEFCVSAVWSNSKGKKLSDPNHPWMIAKFSDGKCKEGATRIVITVDIGQFGINNRYCSVIAWIDTVNSLIEIIQRIGRAIRTTNSLGNVRLVWNARDKEFSDRLNDAIDYMLNMESRLSAFNTLDDISIKQRNLSKKESHAKLNPVDQLLISKAIGGSANSDIDIKDVIDRWEKDRDAPLTESQKDRGSKFVEDIIDIPDYKDRIVWLPESIDYDGSEIVQHELPPDNYDISYLIHAVESGILGGKANPKKYISWLSDKTCEPHEEIVNTITGLVQERDRKIYAVPTVPFTPYQVVAAKSSDCKILGIDSYSLLLFRELSEVIKDVDKDELSRLCRSKATVAARYVFRLPDFKRKSYQNFESQLVNAILHPASKRAIMSIAKVLVIDRLESGGNEIKEFFKEQIDKVRQSIGECQ